MDNEVEFRHPSYGLAQFSRRQGSPKLFGTALEHHYNYVTLSIRRATLIRGDHGDRYHGSLRGDLIEIDLSAAQFAELLTTMNVGMGVPCTINSLNNASVEAPPDLPNEAQGIRDGFKETFRTFVHGLAQKAQAVREILEKKTLNKSDRDQIQRVIEGVVREMSDRAPFVIEMFRESRRLLRPKRTLGSRRRFTRRASKPFRGAASRRLFPRRPNEDPTPCESNARGELLARILGGNPRLQDLLEGRGGLSERRTP